MYAFICRESHACLCFENDVTVRCYNCVISMKTTCLSVVCVTMVTVSKMATCDGVTVCPEGAEGGGLVPMLGLLLLELVADTFLSPHL